MGLIPTFPAPTSGFAWGVQQTIKTLVRIKNARPDLRLPLEGTSHHRRARLRVQLGHLEGLSSKPPGPGPGICTKKELLPPGTGPGFGFYARPGFSNSTSISDN